MTSGVAYHLFATVTGSSPSCKVKGYLPQNLLSRIVSLTIPPDKFSLYPDPEPQQKANRLKPPPPRKLQPARVAYSPKVGYWLNKNALLLISAHKMFS